MQELLEEIGHKMMLPAVRSLAMPIRMTIRNVLRGVYVNTEGVEQVQRNCLTIRNYNAFGSHYFETVYCVNFFVCHLLTYTLRY